MNDLRFAFRQLLKNPGFTMRQIGYRGYISCELCHRLPVVNGETVGIEFAHKNAQLAAEFMREIIRTEYGKKPAKPVTLQPAGAA